MMQTKDNTRNLFAETMVQMLETMSLEKVRVTTLCKRCGMAPATFYYYFRDKYDLVTWIYLQDISDGFSTDKPDFSPESFAAVNRRIKKRKTFYQKAFSDQSQNSLREYMQTFMFHGAKESYKTVTGVELNRQQQLEVKYYVVGILGMFQEWLISQDLELEEIAWLVVEKSPDFLKETFGGSAVQFT